MGLGYDSTRDDYKVVLIEDVMIDNNTHDLQVWIFKLRSNSWKRNIHDNFPHRKDNFIYFGYFVDGDLLYWLCKPSTSDQYAVVTFNVAKEKMVLPHIFLRYLPTNLHVLDGRRLFLSFFDEKQERFNVFITIRDGTMCSWSKVLSITPEVAMLFGIYRFNNVRILGYSKDEDKIMMDLGFEFIVYFDLKARCFETIGTKTLGKDDCYHPFLCHESLVSIGGRQPEWKLKQKLKRNLSHDSLPKLLRLAYAD